MTLEVEFLGDKVRADVDTLRREGDSVQLVSFSASDAVIHRNKKSASTSKARMKCMLRNIIESIRSLQRYKTLQFLNGLEDMEI